MRSLCLMLTLLLLLSLAACGLPGDTPPASPPPVESPSTIEPPVESTQPEIDDGLTAVERLALDWVEAHGADLTGESLVRALYRSLVEQVWFADPVALDSWRYLPGATPHTAIPYLENRALSPLLYKIGSCEDFAAALVMVLRAAGFEADYVAGFTVSVEGDYIDHAWAVVRLEGVWYHLDPQLEQNVSYKGHLTYRYYLRGDSHMLADHRWGENLISFWGGMPDREKAAIRAQFTPPACPADYTPNPAAETIPLPQPGDMAKVERQFTRLKADSGLGELPPIHLNVEPPVLVAEHHITPPLLPGQPAAPQSYGRSFLTGDAAALYDAIAEVSATLPRTGATLPCPNGLTDREIRRVADLFLYDHPAHYALAITLADASSPRALSLDYRPGFIHDQAANQQVLATAAEHILRPLSARASDLQKARFIHDYLAENTTYDNTAQPINGTPHGPLLYGTAFCDGYARAFQYLCQQAGLTCIYIQGSNTRGVPHAWNAIMIDGDWHYVDVTYDCPRGRHDTAYHDYFLITEEEMLREHLPEPGQYPALPAAHSPGYYAMVGWAVSGEPGADATDHLASVFHDQLVRMNSARFTGDPVFLEVKILGDEATFSRWQAYFVAHIFDIARQMESLARAADAPFAVSADETVICDFNPTTRVITFLPKIALVEEEAP